MTRFSISLSEELEDQSGTFDAYAIKDGEIIGIVGVVLKDGKVATVDVPDFLQPHMHDASVIINEFGVE